MRWQVGPSRPAGVWPAAAGPPKAPTDVANARTPSSAAMTAALNDRLMSQVARTHFRGNHLFDRTADPGEDANLAGSAAEAMLGARQGRAAKQFAEQGLGQARAQNNRDTEGYFLELIEAAKRQGG